MKEYGTEMLYKLLQIFFGQADNLMKALILLVIIDYITGVCAAIQEKHLSSRIGAVGIIKKVSIFLVISVSHVADQYLMEQEDVLRTITVVFYLSKYSLQGTTQGNGLTGGLPPVRFSM